MHALHGSFLLPGDPWEPFAYAIELRPIDLDRFAPRAADRPRTARQAVWMRAAGAVPDDPVLHAALSTYMSDLTLLDAALVPHGRAVFEPGIQAASIDHAIRFHRATRADDRLLRAAHSPGAFGGRGFARASLFGRSGRLVASTAQDGLIRHRADP